MKRKGNVTISQCPDPFIGRTKSQNSFRARQRAGQVATGDSVGNIKQR